MRMKKREAKATYCRQDGRDRKVTKAWSPPESERGPSTALFPSLPGPTPRGSRSLTLWLHHIQLPVLPSKVTRGTETAGQNPALVGCDGRAVSALQPGPLFCLLDHLIPPPVHPTQLQGLSYQTNQGRLRVTPSIPQKLWGSAWELREGEWWGRTTTWPRARKSELKSSFGGVGLGQGGQT